MREDCATAWQPVFATGWLHAIRSPLSGQLGQPVGPRLGVGAAVVAGVGTGSMRRWSAPVDDALLAGSSFAANAPDSPCGSARK